MLRNAVGGVIFPGKKRYKGVRFNVSSITRGWVGVKALRNTNLNVKGREVEIECVLQ